MRFIILVCLLYSGFNATGQQFLHAEGQKIVDGQNREVILRGIGIGGWMLQEPYMLQLSGVAGTQHEIKNKIQDLIGPENTAAFYNNWLNNFLSEKDIAALAKWGFNSIRLPMHYRLFTLSIQEEPDSLTNTWVQKGFDLTDLLLKWCSKYHIYLILDLHAAPGGQGNDVAIADRDDKYPSLWQSNSNKAKTIALWKKLAERYANSEWIGGYDLINETNWGFEKENDRNGCAETSNIPLRQLLKRITDTIRSVDRHHIIFTEANCWANNYKGLFPPWDNNLVASFHKYWNYNDEKSIQNFLSIRDEYNIPIWIGESGENSNVWFTDAISLMEKNHIGWAWWPLKKMGINNPLQIIPGSEYDSLVSYWKGKSPKPSSEVAKNVLMHLTEQIRFENNFIKNDVIDAMFRQVQSTATKSFKNQDVGNSARIFASDYDLGRNGYAYKDLDTGNYHVSTGKGSDGNKGHKYRNDGVDIDKCNDLSTNGYKVFSIEVGEWLQYTINVKHQGNYEISFRALSKEESRIEIKINKDEAVKSVSLSSTNNKWTTSKGTTIHLNKGINTIRLYFLNNGLELNYFNIKKKTK